MYYYKTVVVRVAGVKFTLSHSLAWGYTGNNSLSMQWLLPVGELPATFRGRVSRTNRVLLG